MQIKQLGAIKSELKIWISVTDIQLLVYITDQSCYSIMYTYDPFCYDY